MFHKIRSVHPSVCPLISPFIHPSISPSIHPSVRGFSWNCKSSFPEFWYETRNPYQVVCDRAWFSGKKYFCLKVWENGPKIGQKQGFLNLLKDLVINLHWTCSVMKTYIICCVTGQIPYLGKFLFLRYGPKYSQPIG